MVKLLSNKRAKTRLAMELTKEKVRITEATVKDGKLEKILRMLELSLSKDIMENGKIINIEKFSSWLKNTTKKYKFKTKEINLTVPNSLTFVRKHTVPNLSKNQVKEIINQEIGVSIHLPFEKPIIDIVKLDKKQKQTPTVDEDKDLSEVMIVAAPESYILPLVASVEEAGLKPISVDIPALCLFRFLRMSTITETDTTVLILSINETDMDIHIFEDKTLQMSRNVPINIILSELAEGYNVSLTPERVELDLLPEADSFIQDAMNEITRSVNFFQRMVNNGNSGIGAIYVTGIIKPSERLIATLSNTFGVPAQWLVKPHVSKGNLSDENYIGYATVLGLVAKGV